MSLPAGTQIGRYVVRRKLAEGGMAEIYLASVEGPEGFRKDVAVKRVRPALADDELFVQMFIDEARLASRLSHANVVQIFDFDKHEDTYYLAMEYVRGQSLWALRKRAKEQMRPFPPLLVAQIGMEVARALHSAHRLTDRGEPLSLVHRDVSPHNVLLSYEGSVKLTDFGIAKAGNRLTTSGVLKGKFAYMSPEQARGEPVDARTDVFALGIVLWELLTGGRLFEGESDVAVLRAVQESAIAPPARLNPEVPAALDAAVMRALDRDLATRCASAQELEHALQRFILGAARSPEETDVGAYVRSLFPDESAPSEERSAPAPAVRAPPPPPSLAAPVLSGSTTASPKTLSPDEDPHHETFVLPSPVEPAPAAPLPAASARPVRAGRALWLTVALVVLAAVGGGALLRQRSPTVPAVVPARVAPPQTVPEPPSASPEGPTSSESPVVSGPEPAPSSEVPPEREGIETGTLTVRVKPWAKVFVDGRAGVEVEGRKVFRLAAGDHVVRVKHQQTVRTARVHVRAGRDVSQSFSFP